VACLCCVNDFRCDDLTQKKTASAAMCAPRLPGMCRNLRSMPQKAFHIFGNLQAILSNSGRPFLPCCNHPDARFGPVSFGLTGLA
jgi:hypothetical protein